MIGLQVTTKPMDQIRVEIAGVQASAGDVINAFHRLWYAAPFTWGMTYWQGVPILKNPCDLFSVQDMVHDLKPALIIETGTAYGGSALFLAHLCDLVGQGRVITIDVDPPPAPPVHPRITYVRGSSTAPDVVRYVQARVRAEAGPVLVVLDSDHHYAHVAAELEAYAPLVTPGSFLIVEDTNVNGRPVLPEFGAGPGEAVDAFLERHPEFQPDPIAERYLLTMHPNGWLRRVA